MRLRSAAADAGDLAVRAREPRRHNLTDQASIINFIEYNWHLPGIPGSADQVLVQGGPPEGIKFDLAGMFDFKHPQGAEVDPQPGDGSADRQHTRSPSIAAGRSG